MPARLQPITAQTVALRLKLRPGTVTLAAVKAIYTRLCNDALAAGHSDRASGAREASARIQKLIDTPEPSSLAASARLILGVDQMILTATGHRAETAGTYGRFDIHTALATEALELITAYSVLLDAADLELRTGTRAA